MPHKLVIGLFFLISLYATSQVGIGSAIPDNATVLDIGATDKGLLIPRVDIPDLQDIAPITGGDPESLLVYNTNSTTGKGFYFWKDNRWNLLYSSDIVGRGLQYYSYKRATPTESPNIDLSRVRNWNPVDIGMQIDYSGHHTGLLSRNIATYNSTIYNGVILKYVGTYTVRNSGEFHFSSISDDGARIYIDDVLVLNEWSDSSYNEGSGSVVLAEGKHKIEFWVYNNQGDFFFNFSWGANPDYNSGIINSNQFTIEY